MPKTHNDAATLSIMTLGITPLSRMIIISITMKTMMLNITTFGIRNLKFGHCNAECGIFYFDIDSRISMVKLSVVMPSFIMLNHTKEEINV